MTPHPCPECHSSDRVHVSFDGVGYSVACLSCYDWAPDAPDAPHGTGLSLKAALADWAEQASEAAAGVR